MRKLNDFKRITRLIDSAINEFDLNLSGMNVLTEAASGSFVVTPLIAAKAGANKVFALGRDSHYGSLHEVQDYLQDWAEHLEVANTIEFVSDKREVAASQSSIVTNLGFVRPIDAALIDQLPSDAVISLMWEPWEFRASDLDIERAKIRGIPVLGTDESDRRLQTLRHVGNLVLKLLLEKEIEILGCKIMIVGSNPFGSVTETALASSGAETFLVDPSASRKSLETDQVKQFIRSADAVIFVEHRVDDILLSESGGIHPEWLTSSGSRIVHICGNLDEASLNKYHLEKHPSKTVAPKYMTVTTDYVGPKPVIDLHTAGLKIGQAAVEGRRKFPRDSQAALAYALTHSPALML